MSGRSVTHLFGRLALASLSAWMLGSETVQGQGYSEVAGGYAQIAQSPQDYVRPGVPIGQPGTLEGYGAPVAPDVGAGGMAAPAPTTPFAQPVAPPGSAFQPQFAPQQFAAVGGDTFAVADSVGYIDSAIIRSRIRLRYDTSYDFNDPSRAEFFYPACGCLRLFQINPFANGPTQNFPYVAMVNLASTGQPGRISVDRGTGQLMFTPLRGGQSTAVRITEVTPAIFGGGEPRVDYQELTPYFEYAPLPWFSVFVEMPTRYINPLLVDNAGGFSDLQLGFKYAFVAEPDRFITFQFRTYVPTGDGDRGLGTAHASLEPGLLVFQRLTERLFFAGEVRDWISVPSATNGDKGLELAGNVLRYGAGLYYNLLETRNFRLAPVAEFVGWSILSGKELSPTEGIVDASDVTIVNGKFGVRLALGDYGEPGGGSALNDRHSLYLGYGRALTGEHWYEDTFRLEYQFLF